MLIMPACNISFQKFPYGKFAWNFSLDCLIGDLFHDSDYSRRPLKLYYTIIIQCYRYRVAIAGVAT